MRILKPILLHADLPEGRQIPIARPIVDVAGHVETAVRTLPLEKKSDRRRAADKHVEVGALGGGPIIAPRITSAVCPAGRFLPFRIRGKSAVGPTGVSLGLVPAHSCHRLL